MSSTPSDTTAPLRPVMKVQFGILSPEEIVSDNMHFKLCTWISVCMCLAITRDQTGYFV